MNILAATPAPEHLHPVPASSHHRVALNLLANWCGYAINFGVGFLLAPVLVHRLGDIGYGIWALGLQMGTYISLLDFGIRIAVTRYISHHHARGERRQLDVVISTALVALSVVAVLCVSAGIALAVLLPRLFHIPPSFRTDAQWTVFLLSLSVAVTCPGALFTGALAAVSRYDLINIRASATLAARALFIWISLASGFGLVSIALVFFLVTACGYLVEYLIANRVYGGLSFQLSLAEFRSSLTLLGKFGAFAFLMSVATRVVLWTDNIVVGAILGPAAITFYAIGGSLVDNVRTVIQSVTSIFIPIAAALDAQGDRAGLRALLVRGSRLAFLVVYPIIAALFVLGRAFIELWMGKKYSEAATPILHLLLIPALFVPAQATCTQILYATFRHKYLSFWAIAEAALNLALSIVLAYKLGLVGVAWGTLVPGTLVAALVVPIYACRVLAFHYLTFVWKTFLSVICSTFAYPIALIALRRSHYCETWLGFFITTFIGVGVYLPTLWLFCLYPEEKRALAGVFSGARKKVRLLGAA